MKIKQNNFMLGGHYNMRNCIKGTEVFRKVDNEIFFKKLKINQPCDQVISLPKD